MATDIMGMTSPASANPMEGGAASCSFCSSFNDRGAQEPVIIRTNSYCTSSVRSHADAIRETEGRELAGELGTVGLDEVLAGIEARRAERLR